MEVITHSAAETEKLGGKIATDLKPGDVLALLGGLGGGKTTFLKGVARGLGVKQRVVSPTFIINRCYEADRGKIKTFCHFDWYRIAGEKQARALGIEEFFDRPGAVTAIEWAGKAPGVLPADKIAIYFSYGEEENDRRIKIDNRHE